MKTMKIFDVYDTQHPKEIKEQVQLKCKNWEMRNDSYTSISPAELEHEHELKDVADYFRNNGVAEEEAVLILYWW